MLSRSLSRRLVVTSTLWVVGSLVAAGALLLMLFRDHIERRFDQELFDHLEELVAASEIDIGGSLVLTWVPSDPRFARPYSGWYWQIQRGPKISAQSTSVWGSRLAVAPPVPGAGPQVQRLLGPGEQALRALVEDITLPGSEHHFAFVVSGPEGNIDADVIAFASKLALTLGIFGAGLAGAVLLQVRFGLGPLRVMHRALADIRAGRIQRMTGSFPDEVQPVVDELNGLLDENAAMLERARTQAGNLAHALKNPLTVIRNEAARVSGEGGDLLRTQAALVSERVDRYLSQARAAGTRGAIGTRTSVADVTNELIFSMNRLHRDRQLEISVSDLAGLAFRGDRHDLEEMLGNLMDNACKWARHRVVVRGRRDGGRLFLMVEDDGPGIPRRAAKAVLERGRRLDETVPGSGLGLSIVRDIAELCGGALRLAPSTLGGLCAELELAAAD